MKMNQFDKVFFKLINEIAYELGIQSTIVGNNRGFLLERNGIKRFIIGYEFDLNNSSSLLSARNKDITSNLLSLNNIPCIEHRVFLNPKFFIYESDKSNWTEIASFARKYNYQLICKPNGGSFGEDVSYIDNQYKLEETISNLFILYPAIALSPFHKIIKEIRFVILYDQCLLIYEKSRFAVYGDGNKTLLELIQGRLNTLETYGEFSLFLNSIDTIESDEFQLHVVWPKDEPFYLRWKHNTSRYSEIKIIDKTHLVDLALSTTKALNLRFATVDIVELDDGTHKVLEVNSGVCLTKKMYETDASGVKEIYTKALKKMFDIS